MKQLSDKIDINVILPLINSNDSHAIVSGYRVKVSGVRLTSFAVNGTDCICCGREGAFFRVEDNSSGPHLNLYSYGTDDKEKLMTRDHIIPCSQKGPETVANMSTMCSRCNKMRGVLDQAEFLADWKAGKYAVGGEHHDAKMENKKSRRASGVSSACTVEIRELIDAHVAKYGYESHMIKAWDGQMRRPKFRDIVKEMCEELEDAGGLRLAELCGKDSKRKAIAKYARTQHGGQVGTKADYQLARANKTGDLRPAFGILMTLSRQMADNPTEENARRLRDHLHICKDLR